MEIIVEYVGELVSRRDFVALQSSMPPPLFCACVLFEEIKTVPKNCSVNAAVETGVFQ